MRIYTVHELSGAPLEDKGIVLVREGFCWPAFAFNFLWLLWHRLWLVLLAYVALALVLSAAVEWLNLAPAAAFVSSLTLQLLLGFEANDLRRWTLARRGYRTVGITAGHTLVEAEHKFFTRWSGPVAGTPISAPAHKGAIWPRRPSSVHDGGGVLGLFPKAGG